MAPEQELSSLFRQFKKTRRRLYEWLWKVFKRIAYMEKMECYSPKTAFQAGFQKNKAGGTAEVWFLGLTVVLLNEACSNNVRLTVL